MNVGDTSNGHNIPVDLYYQNIEVGSLFCLNSC